MFTIDQLFSNMFPVLEGISWDLGTILTSLIFLWFLAEGGVLCFEMLDGSFQRRMSSRDADTYFSRAEDAMMSRDTHAKGSIGWEEQNMLYRKWLRKSVDSRARGWR